MSFGELRIPGLPGLCCGASARWLGVVLLADGSIEVFGSDGRCCLLGWFWVGGPRGGSWVDASMIVACRRGFG